MCFYEKSGSRPSSDSFLLFQPHFSSKSVSEVYKFNENCNENVSKT